MKSREETLQGELLTWVGSDAGYSCLLIIASRLLKEVKRNGSLAAVWPYPLLSSAGYVAESAVIEEVAHDFYLFLAESFIPQLAINPEHIYLAGSGNFTKLFEYARKKFLLQWKEKARSKDRNPCGYLYRRLRETLSDSPQFATEMGKNSIFLYRLRTGGQTGKFIQTIFQGEDFSTWPVHPEKTLTVPEKEVFKSRYLENAALFFWNEAQKRVAVQAIAARDLNRYLVSQHPWLLLPEIVSESAENSCAEDTESRLDAVVNIESMAALAEQLVAAWSLQQCRVFLLRLEEPPVKLRVIAEGFGWLDHNKVHRVFASCKESLLTFSSNWPGPPLAELPEVCGEVFLEQVKKNAKKRIAVRNE